MIRLCRLGMHLPGPEKIFHRGHLFTRCAECGETLMAGGKGWRLVPRGKRVVWRERTAKDGFFALSRNTDRSRMRLDPIGLLHRR